MKKGTFMIVDPCYSHNHTNNFNLFYLYEIGDESVVLYNSNKNTKELKVQIESTYMIKETFTVKI